MSGTGRRRKPPVGEEGGGEQGGSSGQYAQYPAQPGPSAYESAYDEQQAQQQPPDPRYPQYQTYAQPAEPQYDYDWRQTPGPAPGYEPPAAYDPPAYEPPPQPAYSPPPGYSAAPRVPQQQSWDQPAAASPIAEPAAPLGRPRPRPEPRPEAEPPAPTPFEFEFDPDDEQVEAAPAASAEAPAADPSNSRPSDKDGYRPGDFAFVDQADEPDVKGWLSFSESRADSRAERGRKLRFRLIALAVVLVLVGAGVGVYKWLGGGASAAGGAAAATKSMILFRLDDTAGDSVGDALMVTKRNGSTTGGAVGDGAIVVIPAQMQVDSEGFGDEPFGGDMASDEPPAGSDEVASALGVTPDGVWTMDETTFGIFVDELGGLTLTTNAAVPASSADPKGVAEGTETLTGVQAVAYATYQGSGEAATAQAVRFGQVLNALMAKMPTYNDSVEAYLNQLGLIPDPSLPLSELGPILAALAAQQQGNRVTVATLPLTTGDSLNDTAAAEIVSTLLGGTAKAGASAGQAARVLVQNGTGTSTSAGEQLMAVAQGKLADAGYTYNAGDVVTTQAKTEVEVASSADQGLAEQVAASLGLSGATVQVVSGLASVDDVTVVLGQDWSSLSAD
jgi:hypothetical protein